MWSTLEQTNVNDIIRPFGAFGNESPDSLAGGHQSGPHHRQELEDLVSRSPDGHRWHSVLFNDRSDAHPFGVFKEVEKGRIVVMGDGMVSL